MRVKRGTKIELFWYFWRLTSFFIQVPKIAWSIVSKNVAFQCATGFENPNSACCHLAGRFGGLIPCNRNSKVCEDRSKYVFWDTYHPSDAANAVIAERLINGDTRDILPINICQLSKA